jgi:hypothetical protein
MSEELAGQHFFCKFVFSLKFARRTCGGWVFCSGKLEKLLEFGHFSV